MTEPKLEVPAELRDLAEKTIDQAEQAFGMFFDWPVAIRVAGIWMIPGLVVWFLYVFLEGVFLTSTLAHIGGLIVGLLALRRVGVDRRAWLYALAWYFVVQLVSRVVTPDELNVNVSKRIYAGWEGSFNAYWKFWLALSLIVAALLSPNTSQFAG